MSYDFTPRNKKAGDYSIGSFTWGQMLDAGLGFVLGVGPGFRPGHFIYIIRPDDRCVRANDGARVTAKECRELAKVARWIAEIQSARIIHWNELPPEEQQQMLNVGPPLYQKPWVPELVQQYWKFADWCERAGGFRID